MVMNRLAGEVSPERVVEMLEAGAQPLQDLIAALHTKLMVARARAPPRRSQTLEPGERSAPRLRLGAVAVETVIVLVSDRHFAPRAVGFCLALLALLAVGLAVWAGNADAKTIYACAQKQGSTVHRAKAAMRLVRRSAACLPWERRLSWQAGSGGPTASAVVGPGHSGPSRRSRSRRGSRRAR